MSNYDKIPVPGLPGVLVGAEDANGTGEVTLYISDEDESDGGNSAFLSMDAETALKLAELIADQAFAALRQKWKLGHLSNS